MGLIKNAHPFAKRKSCYALTTLYAADITMLPCRQLKVWKKDSILSLPGKQDKIDSNYIFYRIAQQRPGAILLHTNTLAIKFTACAVE